MKKIAVIESGYGWENIIKILIERGCIVDFYTYNPDSVNIKGLNKVFLLTQEYRPKEISSIVKLSNEIRNQTKDKKYDHIISPGLFIEFGNNVFHFNSIVYRQKILNSLIERFFYYLGHKSRIQYFKNWYRPQHQKTFVVSNNLKEDYSKNCKIPKDKIIVAHPGHNLKEDLNSYKKPFCEDTDDFVFGASAVGFNRKGGYLILKAMFHLSKKYLNVKCKIIYPGYENNRLVKFMINILNLKDKVEFLGYQKGMTNFYNSVHCLVMPSNHEAFGLVTTEAMMYRKPVLVSSCSGVADIITEGENGFIFDISKNKVKNLVNKMEYIMQNYNKLDICIENAFNTAKSLTWDNFAETVVDNL